MHVSEAGGNFQIFLFFFFLQSRFYNHTAHLGHTLLFKEEWKKRKIVPSFLHERLISQFKLNIINQTSIQSVKCCFREVERFCLASRKAR